MARNLLGKVYGRVRFSKKKKSIEIDNIHYQKPERQIGLDNAIKQHQADLQKQKAQKKAQRQKTIKKFSKLLR